MSGSSSANNSWTILTPEETVAETLRPLAERTEHHEESLTSAEGSGANQTAEGSPVEGHLVSEEQTVELNEDTSTEPHTFVPSTVTVPSAPTSSDVSRSFVPGSDALSQSEGLPEGPAQSIPDPDSFSDSYTHVTPSPDEPPAALLITETVVGGAFRKEKGSLTEEGTQHLLNEEERQWEEEGSDLSLRTTELGKQADSPEGVEVGKEKTGVESETEVRRQRSLLTPLERIGRTEEEEEEFQLPLREEDSGFSVNKCILGAVILVGLGTIFFSESNYGTRELKDSQIPGKQEWVPPPPGDADNMEKINKLAEGNQQILLLQDQLQAQNEELKVARGHAAEGANERLRREEVEKENSRLKTEMASLPVLQKENDRMKRELESVTALQKELEMLRSTLTGLKLSSATESSEDPLKSTTLPPSGHTEDTRQGTVGTGQKQERKPWVEQKESIKDLKKDKYDTGEKKDSKDKEKPEWKEEEKRDHKDIGKSERGKHEQGKFDKEKDREGKQKKHSDETKQRKEKDRKKEKASRGDEGKPWKAREEKREWREKSEKEERDWKKSQHEKVNEDTQWRNKDEKKDWIGGNDYKDSGKEKLKAGEQLKKEKNGFKESGKAKWERKDWKKEWKNDGELKTKHGKDQGNEGKRTGDRKDWEESKNHGKIHAKEKKGKDEGKQWSENGWKSKNAKVDKEWNRKDEKKQHEKKEEWKRGGLKEKKHEDWKKDRSGSEKHKDDHSVHHHKEHLWGDRNSRHTHSRPSLQQPEYWVRQKDRLQHNHKPQHCSSVEACAQAEGLLPVSSPDFEAILQTYLAKAEEVGVERPIREELKKLTARFFKDGAFVHDQMSFRDFVEDVGDILEDMVEGNENGEEEEDGAVEEEMEEFEKEVIKKFSVPGAGKKEEKIKGDWRKEKGRGHG